MIKTRAMAVAEEFMYQPGSQAGINVRPDGTIWVTVQNTYGHELIERMEEVGYFINEYTKHPTIHKIAFVPGFADDAWPELDEEDENFFS